MKSMGGHWDYVYGGKYHINNRPKNNPSRDIKYFSRPYCKCKISADINDYNDKLYWRCSKKNIWDNLQDYLYSIEYNKQFIEEPCDFYKEYNSKKKI